MLQSEKVGVYQIYIQLTKISKLVVDVLQSKHPDEHIPETLEDLEAVPLLSHIDILQEIVEDVAKKMGGGAGPGGVDVSQL